MLTDPYDDYARGFIPFLGTTIHLDSHPLIPRVETEFWVEQAISHIKNTALSNNSPLRVLDLFSGSGAIGVAILKHLPTAHVTFGELEERHLETIEKNIIENNIDTSRAEVVQTDVWSNLEETFDLILANPPYVSRERGTAEESTLVEPSKALYAPDDGFFYIKKFIEGLHTHLLPSGVAYVEHEPYQTERISTTARSHRLSVKTEVDQYQVERFSILTFSTD